MDALLDSRQQSEGGLRPVDRPSSSRSGHLFSKMAAPVALGGTMLLTSLMVGNIIHPTLGKKSVDPSLKELPTTIARECEAVILDFRSQIHYLLDRNDFGHPLTLVLRQDIGSGQHGKIFFDDTCTFRVHEHDGETRAKISFGTVQKHYKEDDSVQPPIHEGKSAETLQQDTSLSLQLDKKFDNFQGENSSYSLSWPRDRHPNYIHESQERPQEGFRSFFREVASIFGFRPKLDVDTLWKKSSSDAVISAARNLQDMAEKRLQDTMRQEEATR